MYKLEERHPVDVMLDTYVESSRRIVESRLDIIAKILTSGDVPLRSLDWSTIQYEHFVMVRRQLALEYKPSSANFFISIIRKWTRVLHKMGIITLEQLVAMQDLERFPESNTLAGSMMSKEDMQLFLSIAEQKEGIKGTRDYALLLVLLSTGVRRMDLVNFKVSAFSFEAKSIDVLDSKNNNSRTIYLPDKTIDALLKWLDKYEYGSLDEPLFVGIRNRGKGELLYGKKMSTNAIYKLIKWYCKKAGINEYTPHDLRRTFISTLIDEGIDLVTISNLAGHKNIQQTAEYDRRGTKPKQNAAALLNELL